MTDNTKPQSAVALPATRPETYYPTYSEAGLRHLLEQREYSPYLSTCKWGTDTPSDAEYIQPHSFPVNLPILKPAEIRDALRQILLNKQAAFAKRYREEQAKIFEELQKLTAIGYEAESPIPDEDGLEDEAFDEDEDEDEFQKELNEAFAEDETSDYADDSGHCGDGLDPEENEEKEEEDEVEDLDKTNGKGW